MRSSFIRLFPHGRCYSLHFYHFVKVILVFPSWEVLWSVCLFPHDRCYLLYSHCLPYICCYFTADVIHCTLCSGFFAVSISLRFHRHLDFQFVLFLFIGVLSFLFCFSFPGIRSSFSVCSLMADVFHCIFHCFYNCKNFACFNSFSSSLCFAGLSFIVRSLLAVFSIALLHTFV